MPTMASVKLSMGQPIVTHPHYEDAGLRERTKLVYSMYSGMSGETVKRNLMKLGVDFFVLEDSWCNRRTRYHITTSRGVACQKFGTLRIPKIINQLPSASCLPLTSWGSVTIDFHFAE
ncbi:probable C-mannosyltransferase DPY19L1 [Neoarius graeffei]|uniref:probable C-mannosyltransferase DPY19L1 n=1 Tax=Neoarius graeffei TaxID=443677 RepID=UPI00298CE949|nr:probable C-mannosyltransferase DPY19L1 [Neoarius graeffei]